MEILVLGGTRFVGRHMVEAAAARGHSLTLFNRGNHPEVFPEIAAIHGDRDQHLSRLGGRAWDAVIDTSAYLPRQLRQSVEALQGRIGAYLFVSTVSVYAAPVRPRSDERAPLAELPGADAETVTPESYGALKALCERELQGFPGRRLVLRPGVVVGPFDPTDRFTYWPLRIAAGGEVLLPRGPGAPVQWIDARDLAAFALELLEGAAEGTFNVVTDPRENTFGSLFEACAAAARSSAQPRFLPEDFLLEQGVAPFRDLPLWLPEEEEGLALIDNAAARAAGLSCRSAEESAGDVLAWAARERSGELRAGLERGRERQLLEAWGRRRSQG